MSERPMTILRFAQLVGVHPDTVRRLERKGVLPTAKRDRNGNRIYTTDDVLEARAIVFPQAS